MKYLLGLFLLLLLSCRDDDQNHQRLSLEELCAYTPRAENSKDCVGEFLLHIKDKEGEVRYSDQLGYYLNFSMEKTYDCEIIGVICQDIKEDRVGVRVSRSEEHTSEL